MTLEAIYLMIWQWSVGVQTVALPATAVSQLSLLGSLDGCGVRHRCCLLRLLRRRRRRSESFFQKYGAWKNSHFHQMTFVHTLT